MRMQKYQDMQQGLKFPQKEVGHINDSLKTKYIPMTKLFIKYYNKLTSNGDFPTILVISATNFSATFEKVD